MSADGSSSSSNNNNKNSSSCQYPESALVSPQASSSSFRDAGCSVSMTNDPTGRTNSSNNNNSNNSSNNKPAAQSCLNTKQLGSTECSKKVPSTIIVMPSKEDRSRCPTSANTKTTNPTPATKMSPPRENEGTNKDETPKRMLKRKQQPSATTGSTRTPTRTPTKRPASVASVSERSETTTDPLVVALSKTVREYLASIRITTAAQLLLARTTDVAEHLPQWRRTRGMAALNGRTGALSSVSVWKKKVRKQALLVGANKLATVNVGTNSKMPTV
mmetsp:Transcript_5707/g.13264  ORF Transcript_5707/g.13264 Transcript_5707/m.13264 type:complete len:274 (-) Transcript_5707:44-865(-)